MSPFPKVPAQCGGYDAAPRRPSCGLTFIEGFTLFMIVVILGAAWGFAEIVRGNAQIEVQAGVNHNAMEIEITKRQELQLSFDRLTLDREKLEFVKAYVAAQQALAAESEAERADVWIQPPPKIGL